MFEPDPGMRNLNSKTERLILASLAEKNTGTTFMGDFTLYAPIDINHYGFEMGILMTVQIYFFVTLMGRLNGRGLHMVHWIHSQDFEIFGNIVKSARWVNYLSIVGYSYLIFPFMTLILWFVSLTKAAKKDKKELDHQNPIFMGAFSVLLLGIAMILVLIGMQKIRWNNYRFKPSHMIIFLFAFMTVTAWQFSIAFASMFERFNFQGISIIFLTQSGIIATICIYINLYENKFNLLYFLTKFMKKGQKEDFPNPKRTNDLSQEIEAQKADDDWLPSMHDVYDIITIGKVSDKKMLNAFGAGFQELTLASSRCYTLSVHLILAAIYFGILAVYSYLVYNFDNGSKLGIVSSVAVITNDLYVILMYNARIINHISILSLIIFCSRLFILLGGAHFWIYGYLVIFVWLQSIIALGIVRRRLPLNSEIDNNENVSLKKTHFLDMARVPEFIFILITVSICISIAVAESVNPKGVFLSPLQLGDISVTHRTATMFAILIVVTVLLVSSWLRAFKRRIDETTSEIYLYLCCRVVDQYYVICIINYGISIFWTLSFYRAYPNYSVLLVGLFTPAIFFIFFNIIKIYIRNSYFFIENNEGINRNILAHNKRVDEIKARGREIRKVILESEKGADAIYGKENEGLVKKVMDIEIARRKAFKLEQRKLKDEQSSDDESGQHIQRSRTGILNSRRRRMSVALTTSPLQDLTVPPADNSLSSDSFAEEEKEQLVADNSMREGNNNVMASNNAAFGGTMMGFKLDGDESSEEDIDAIPPYMRAYYPTRIDKKRKQITTWQKRNLSWTKAFFTSQMRTNDIDFLFSCLFLGALIIILGALGAVYSYKGSVIMFAFTVLHVVLLCISMLGYVLANRRITIPERILQASAFLILYISSIVYMIIAYDIGLLSKENGELNPEQLYEKNACINFVSSQMIIAPLCTSIFAFGARVWRDSHNNRKTSIGFFFLLTLIIIHLASLVIFMFIYLERLIAIGLSCVIAFILYALLQYVLRYTYKDKAIKISDKILIQPHKLNMYMDVANYILVTTVFLTSYIALTNSENMYSTVAVQSLVIWLMIVILFFAALARFIADRTRMDEMPIYHSPYVFPIYRYYPKLNDIEPYASGIVLFYALAAIAFIWSVYITVQVRPSWMGVSVTCAVECMTIFFTLHIANTNNAQYKKISPYVDPLVIKTAWCDAKQNLVKMLHIQNRAEFESYEKWWRRRHILKNYMLLQKGKDLISWPETSEFEMERQELDTAEDKGDYLRKKIQLWAHSDEVNLDSWEECLKFMHETDLDVRRAYLAELETIIQFQLIILQNAKELKNEERKYLFKFIKEKRAELYMVGINFQVSSHENSEVRYALAQTEIRKLVPDKHTLFNSLFEKFSDDERRLAIDEQIAEKDEQRKNLERQEMFFKINEARAASFKQMEDDKDMPIDEMPDCPEKLQKIRAQAKNGKKFTDVQFDHADEEAVYGDYIYSKKSERQITGWKRASEIHGAKLFHEGAKPEDINQGMLGDCYLLSALSVLSNDRIVELFVCQEDSKQHEDQNNPINWKETGCFMLKFFKNDAIQIIIVDDWIPWSTIEAIGQDQPAFVRGGEDNLEMWPCILEKAYAKLYGSYSNIESGKIHLALADMVENGFPEQFVLATIGKNMQVFKNMMRKLETIKALRGASSPAGSDSNASEEGIQFGHAYSIHQVVDYDNEQLVQLRNPWGTRADCKEWTGEWGDNSERWNESTKEHFNYDPQDSVDGLFWMNQTDFIQQFQKIYVCLELSKKAGYYSNVLKGKWAGASAAGFVPSKLRAVPQFTLKVNFPTHGYLVLTQLGDDSGSSFKGKNQIGWIVSRESGKLVTKSEKAKRVAMAGCSDIKKLSAEVDFEQDTYTIVCGAIKRPGFLDEGSGDFELKVYTGDPYAELKYLNYKEDY